MPPTGCEPLPGSPRGEDSGIRRGRDCLLRGESMGLRRLGVPALAGGDARRAGMDSNW